MGIRYQRLLISKWVSGTKDDLIADDLGNWQTGLFGVVPFSNYLKFSLSYCSVATPNIAVLVSNLFNRWKLLEESIVNVPNRPLTSRQVIHSTQTTTYLKSCNI